MYLVFNCFLLRFLFSNLESPDLIINTASCQLRHLYCNYVGTQQSFSVNISPTNLSDALFI